MAKAKYGKRDDDRDDEDQRSYTHVAVSKTVDKDDGDEEVAAPKESAEFETAVEANLEQPIEPAVAEILAAIRANYQSTGDIHLAVQNVKLATAHWPAELEAVEAALADEA